MKTTSKLINVHMHAWITTQFNNLNHILALDYNIPLNHARINSIQKQEGKYPTLGLEFKVYKLNLPIHFQFSQFSKQILLNPKFLLTLSLLCRFCL